MPILSQVVIVTEKYSAGSLGTSAIAAVDYARIISETAVLVISMPIGLAALPRFATLSAREFRDSLERVISVLIPVAVVVSVLAFVEARGIVKVLFGRGEFDEASVNLTADISAGFALGIWALLLNYFLTKTMNSRFRNWDAVATIAISAVVTLTARPFLVGELGATGLGLAVSVGAIIGAIYATARLAVFLRTVTLIVSMFPTFVVGYLVGAYLDDCTWNGVAAGIGAVSLVGIVNMLAAPAPRAALRSILSGRRRDAEMERSEQTAHNGELIDQESSE
ncbi:hypothetical protein GOALK_024_00090 [Gordonia alkanivorans NBRC 16433]|uniref:Uncharacterized protein n=2 Tax=Gordonia alkanivorans TaxID=84096 RepID=F9VRF4_9ACTN|nr:hypothetical protein GOALK_024_00090 [Gordonia alkanivorans NBRC 16433]